LIQVNEIKILYQRKHLLARLLADRLVCELVAQTERGDALW
jgi:hypothetical protein